MPMEAMEDITILRQNFPLSRMELRIFLSHVRSGRLHERPTTQRRLLYFIALIDEYFAYISA